MAIRARPPSFVSALLASGVVVVLGACGAATRGGELEPRYVAVHNAFAAIGLAQVGPLVQGTLAEGREDKVSLDLGAQCTTIVAIGGRGVRDVDLALLDPSGAPVAHDVTREPEATLRACVEVAGTYTLVLKMAAGSGDYLLATWAGGGVQAPGAAPASSGGSAAVALGTCDSPISIAAGNFTGSTARGETENEGSCANSSAREVVYKLDLVTRQRVSIDLVPRFDSVLYVRKDECGEADAEVACNDDAPNQHRSKIDAVLDPATYYVFVDGYGNESGSYAMHVSVADVPSIAEVCRQARPLVAGAPQTGNTGGAFDRVNASCGEGAKGPDIPFRLDLDRRSRVRLVESSSDFTPIVHLRRQCADEASEIGCGESGAAEHEASFVGMLDRGSYTVFADAAEHDADGQFSLAAETAPEQGAGTGGDGCGDAIPLTRSDPAVHGDTFNARDDVAGRCSGAGAGDVVYRIEVARRSRISARMGSEEGEHVFSLMRTCADRSTELACERAIDQVLMPGTYYLAVDGANANPGVAGRYMFEFGVRDVAGQEAACRAPPVLGDGQTVTGTTAGQTDKWSSTCAGREDAQSAPDKVYRIVLGARARVRLSLSTPSWDGVLALRASCLDPSGATSPRAAEIACNNDSDDTHHARLEATLDAGTYYVLVDGHASGNEGAYSLEYRVLRAP